MCSGHGAGQAKHIFICTFCLGPDAFIENLIEKGLLEMHGIVAKTCIWGQACWTLTLTGH